MECVQPFGVENILSLLLLIFLTAPLIYTQIVKKKIFRKIGPIKTLQDLRSLLKHYILRSTIMSRFLLV